jgi:hypothetical protein
MSSCRILFFRKAETEFVKSEQPDPSFTPADVAEFRRPILTVFDRLWNVHNFYYVIALALGDSLAFLLWSRFCDQLVEQVLNCVFNAKIHL